MKKYLLLSMFLPIMFPVARAGAQTAVGYDFLRTLVGARPAGMAGAFVGVVGDIHSLAYNPAGISYIHEKSGTLSYLNDILDFNSGFVAFALPFARGTAAASLSFIDYGQFDRRSESNEDLGEFGSNGMTFAVSYAQPVLTEGFALGGSAKYIRFQIDSFTAAAMAVDFGLSYTISAKELSFGLSVLNLGSTTNAFFETKDDLPMSIQFGASKKLEHLPVMVSGALVKYKDESLDFRLGGEITFTPQLFARLGYNSIGQDQKIDASNDRFAGVSFGLGFKLNKFDIDYSLSSFGEVGSLNRFSLVGRF